MGATQIAQTETFAELYRRHRAGVYAAAYRISGRAEDAEDVTQDVFVRLWRRPGSFDAGRGDLGSYLRLMARSRALDLWRTGQAGARARGRLELLAGSAEDSGEARPAEMAELHEERAVVRAALMTLPFEQREALVLSYWGGLEAREVAERSEVPFGTAKSRMRLGLEKLRRECAAA